MRVTDSKEEDAVPSRRRHRSTDTLETVVVRCGGSSCQKRTVARPQLGDSDALASGPSKSPACLRVGVSSEGAMSG